MNAIYTKEFWLRVQQEHQASPQHNAEFLCNSSNAFQSIWNHRAHDVRELAAMFVAQDEHWNSLVTIDHHHGSVLFHPMYDGALHHANRIQLRKQFIEWNIKRVS
jgi:hypothetical protein